jgi:hypothetical protein
MQQMMSHPQADVKAEIRTNQPKIDANQAKT